MKEGKEWLNELDASLGETPDMFHRRVEQTLRILQTERTEACTKMCIRDSGETCKLALLVGAAYLFYKKVITWHIPTAFIGTFAVCYLLKTGFDVNATLTQLLSLIHI